MGLILLFIGITALLAVGAKLIDKFTYGCLEIFVGGVAAILGFVVFVMLGVALYMPITIQEEIAEYEGLKQTVTNSRLETSLSYGIERAGFLEKVVKCNQKIMKHRAFYNNKWIGCYYSEKIASLELILLE